MKIVHSWDRPRSNIIAYVDLSALFASLIKRMSSYLLGRVVRILHVLVVADLLDYGGSVSSSAL